MATLALVAGDPSGDAHGAQLVNALKALDPSLRFLGLGGPRLEEAGVRLLDHLTHAASIGPFDAAKHLGQFVHARDRLAEALRTDRPDAVILIDFGDYNLPVIAPLAKRAGCRVIYYISPQLWAWGRFRLHWVRRYVDRMIVLFRFEEAFYQRVGVPVTWVGHPLMERTVDERPAPAKTDLGLNPWRMTVGLMPGSRRQEVERHLPLMLRAAQRIAWHMPGLQFLLPKAAGLPEQAFQALRQMQGLDIVVTEDRMSDCLQAMDAAIVASGTATLEAALYRVPMAVVYRTSLPTYLAAKSVLRIPHIAMVNVIAGRSVVPEFVQYGARPGRIASAIVSLLRDRDRRERMRAELQMVREQLGPPGSVDRAARAVLNELRAPNGGLTSLGTGSDLPYR